MKRFELLSFVRLTIEQGDLDGHNLAVLRCTYNDEVLDSGYYCDDTTLKESKTFFDEISGSYSCSIDVIKHVTLTPRSRRATIGIYMGLGVSTTESPLLRVGYLIEPGRDKLAMYIDGNYINYLYLICHHSYFIESLYCAL